MHTPGKSATARNPLQTASAPHVPRRAYQRLRVHRRMLPLLAALTLLAGLLVSGAAYVGIRVALPGSVPDAVANELGLALLLISLLMTALAVLCGALFSGAPSSAALAKLDLRLNEVAGHAADLEQLVRAQVGRSQRQSRLARQVNECARELNTLMEVVEQGQEALGDAAGETWASLSQPGQALDPATVTRMAQQSAVISGRIGAASEDARERCRHLIGMMNQVIAEGRVLGDEGHGLEERANALRTAIERVEVTLGAKVVDRQYDLPGHPFARRLRRTSRRLKGAVNATYAPANAVRTGWSAAPDVAGPRSGNITADSPGAPLGFGGSQDVPRSEWLSSLFSPLPARPLAVGDTMLPPLSQPIAPPPPPHGDQTRHASGSFASQPDGRLSSYFADSHAGMSLPGISSPGPLPSFADASLPNRPSLFGGPSGIPLFSDSGQGDGWMSGQRQRMDTPSSRPAAPQQPLSQDPSSPDSQRPQWPLDGTRLPLPQSDSQQTNPSRDIPPMSRLND
jgi:hypothetical protein